MTKLRQAIILGVLTMVATVIIFILMPKPAMYGKMYIQFSFIILAQLICICSYAMLPEKRKHLKSAFLIIFLIVVIVFNALLGGSMDLRGVIATNMMILLSLLVVVLITNRWLAD